MLRVRTLHILATACAGGGLACYLLTAARGGTAGPAVPWAAPAFFAMSAAAAWAASHRFRLNCRDLARQLQTPSPATVGPISRTATSSEPPLADLVSAVNQILTSAAETAMKARELQIHLKLATAEQQHTQAILQSISDAVLVTDPFDQLVLANESAARTFEFDLARHSVACRGGPARPQDGAAHPRDAAGPRRTRQEGRRAPDSDGGRPANVQGHPFLRR